MLSSCKARADLLSASKDGDSSFHHCGGVVRLVQALFGTGIDRECNFHHRGGAVKLVQACLNAREDEESNFL